MQIVKMLTNDDGDKYENPPWHMVVEYGDAARTVCGGEVFGDGESSAKFKTRPYKPGAITCRICKETIKWYKSIPL